MRANDVVTRWSQEAGTLETDGKSRESSGKIPVAVAEIIDDAVNVDQDVAVIIEEVRDAPRAERVAVVWKFVWQSLMFYGKYKIYLMGFYICNLKWIIK